MSAILIVKRLSDIVGTLLDTVGHCEPDTAGHCRTVGLLSNCGNLMCSFLCRLLSYYCQTTVRLSYCSTIGGLSDDCQRPSDYCRSTVGVLSEYSGNCCRTFGPVLSMWDPSRIPVGSHGIPHPGASIPLAAWAYMWDPSWIPRNPTRSHKIPLPMLLSVRLFHKSISAGIGLRIYCIVRILWDPRRISWDPTPRGIYTTSHASRRRWASAHRNRLCIHTGILWDPRRISWDPTPRGIYTTPYFAR